MDEDTILASFKSYCLWSGKCRSGSHSDFDIGYSGERFSVPMTSINPPHRFAMILENNLFHESNGRPLTGIQPLNRENLVAIALTSLWNLLR